MTFIDTNVFVYLIDGRDPLKQSRARSIISDAFGCEKYMISSQVLNEFANVALKKFGVPSGRAARPAPPLGVPIEDVRRYVKRFSRICIVDQQHVWTDRALQIKSNYGLQFYDSLLLATAEASGCDEIYTEDLNDGQLYCGIKAVNPFGRAA